MSYNFCRFTKEEENGMFEILNKSFEVTKFEKIVSSYDTFRENYYHPEIQLKFEAINRAFLNPRTTDKSFQEKFQNLSFHIGIDLPILLRPARKTDKTVLIVAEDPLRNHSLPKEEIIFSTPFGTHIENCREKKLKVYWEVIQNLLDNGYNVYVTDIVKLWLKEEHKVKVRVPLDLMNNFHNSLYKEIEIFNPQLILTYGKSAFNLIQNTNLKLETKKLSFPHPSPTANRAWKKIFINNDTIRCTAENKINYMTNEIKKCFPQ